MLLLRIVSLALQTSAYIMMLHLSIGLEDIFTSELGPKS